jgi:hypothetical protein
MLRSRILFVFAGNLKIRETNLFGNSASKLLAGSVTYVPSENSDIQDATGCDLAEG